MGVVYDKSTLVYFDIPEFTTYVFPPVIINKKPGTLLRLGITMV